MQDRRFLLVNQDGSVTDTDDGMVTDSVSADVLLRGLRGGVIAGRNLYPVLARIVNEITGKDQGWSAKIHCQEQRTSDPNKVRGIIYFSHITYRFPKRMIDGQRRRVTVKWLVINTELFTEELDIGAAAKSLVKVSEQRGITPRFSPGSFGAALLRASPEWNHLRRPAPWFISDAAREHIPGNYYAIRHGHRKTERGYYLDQSSAHHTVASEVSLPHPHYLRARGRFRRVETGDNPIVFRDTSILREHVGVIVATVRCSHIPSDRLHLYPAWAREKGDHSRWIWTPELRLLDSKVQLLHISSMLTSVRADPALREYAEWSLDRLSEKPGSAVKPALLAAYGMLAIRTKRDMTMYAANSRPKPPRAQEVSLPLLPRVMRSTVQRTRVPSVQNVVARGVIESEVLTRSIELARNLELEGVPVVHIYADGLIAATDQLPFLIPPNWRVAAELTGIYSRTPNSIVSRELVRMPGIPNGRRTAYMRRDDDGYHMRENEPKVSGM
jgi:hypothetical protein